MKEINKFRTIYELKEVYRENSVGKRKESSAEHSWSCLVLADYFMSKYDIKLDKLKVYELLMYHDLLEIETGDIPLNPNNTNKIIEKNEEEEMKKLENKLPSPINQKFIELYKEYKERKTKEAKFSKAIDVLDAQIHELDYKEDWKGWTKEFLIEQKIKYVREFSPLEEAFNEILEYLIEKKFLEE
jgi:putative hydrolases of HD superfamily